MTLSNLATVTTAGGNSVFTYFHDTDDYTTISTDGYFDEARNVLDNKAVIFVQSPSGLSFHFVFSQLGEDTVGTADYQPPLTANVNSVDANTDFNFNVAVDGGNKIKRDEIEEAITDAGFDLPTRSLTIYVQDLDNDDKQYSCRYDKIQDEWFQELYKKAD